MNNETLPGKAINAGASEMGVSVSAGESAKTATFNSGTLCPDGGTYSVTIEESSVLVECSKHGQAKNLGQEKIIEELKEAFDNIDKKTSNIAFADANTLQALEAAGLNFKELGVASWGCINNPSNANGQKLYWTTSPIESGFNGVIPVMSYNLSSRNYVVWNMEVVNGVLKREFSGPLNPDANNDQTYDKALAIYNEKKKF